MWGRLFNCVTATELLLLALLLIADYGGCAVQNSPHDFDVLLFTQQWPVTTCIEWKDQNPDHICVLPSPKDMWTIHGVWPTRLGTIGPAFCNKTAVFDPTQLAPFEDQLEQFWTNIEKGQKLWQHEWLKHGTCASVLPELDSEHKYFGRGLSWLHQYSMSSVLSTAGIQPRNAYTVDAIHTAIVTSLHRRPYIRCIRDKHTQQTFLSEIRICFAKNMTLVDCDGVKLKGDDDVDGVIGGGATAQRLQMPKLGADTDGGNVGGIVDTFNDAYAYESMFGDDDDIVSAEAVAPTMLTNCPPDAQIWYPGVVPQAKLSPAERPATVARPKPNPDVGNRWRFPWLDVYKLLNLIKAATL